MLSLFMFLICFFGGTFGKSLQEINNDLQYVVSEMKSKNIFTSADFEDAVGQFNSLIENINEVQNLKTSKKRDLPITTMTKLIKKFIDYYQHIYSSFEEFFEKWKNGEIPDISISPEQSENNSTSSEFNNSTQPENNSTNSSNEESSQEESSEESLDKESSEESLDKESSEESLDKESSEESLDKESLDKEQSEEDIFDGAQEPEWLLKLFEVYKDIIIELKEEFYPALIFFDNFTTGVVTKIDDKFKYLNFELLKNRFLLEKSTDGLMFNNFNNTYLNYFLEQGNSVDEIIMEVDLEYICPNITNFENSTFIDYIENVCNEFVQILKPIQFLKEENNELNDRFNKIIEKFNILDSCIEESEEETPKQPTRPNYNRNGTTWTTILLGLFFLLVL
jgi:hypothetical protein